MLDDSNRLGPHGVAAGPISTRPRFAPIPGACHYGGIGRGEIYEKHRQREEARKEAAKKSEEVKKRPLLRKWGRKTLVDLDVLDEILDEMPAAELRPISCIHDDPEVLARRERSKAQFRAQRKRKRKQRAAGEAA